MVMAVIGELAWGSRGSRVVGETKQGSAQGEDRSWISSSSDITA